MSKRSGAIVAALSVVLLAPVGSAEPPKQDAAAPLETEEQRTLYAAGLMLGRGLASLALKPGELELVLEGVKDAARGAKPEVDLQVYGPKVQALAQARQADQASVEKTRGLDFAAKAAAEPDAVKSESGLVYKTLVPGTGDSPTAADTVKVHYGGTLIDGTEFDSSVRRGQPAEFKLSAVIPCWTEGVQKMKVGEKARLVCPSSIAYGDRGRPPTIPGGATLVFEVELLEIKK